MAEREEVISVVSYASDGGLSWRFNPENVEYQFKRFGIMEGEKALRAEFEKALSQAKKHCSDKCFKFWCATCAKLHEENPCPVEKNSTESAE